MPGPPLEVAAYGVWRGGPGNFGVRIIRLDCPHLYAGIAGVAVTLVTNPGD